MGLSEEERQKLLKIAAKNSWTEEETVEFAIRGFLHLHEPVERLHKEKT